jgi:hypothetical protein
MARPAPDTKKRTVPGMRLARGVRMTKTVMFNPYTGTPRHPSDIASDPSGLLM